MLAQTYQQYNPQQYTQPSMPAESQQATNVCHLCHNQGHYNYQCQFAGDFMASSLQPTKVALLQPKTKIDVLPELKDHQESAHKEDDPYPWLHSDDPRQQMSNEEILMMKVPLDKSILTVAEKEKLTLEVREHKSI